VNLAEKLVMRPIGTRHGSVDVDRFVAISGCSGGGKSTLLVELGRRGYSIVESLAVESLRMSPSLAAAGQLIDKGSGLGQLRFIVRGGGGVPTVSHCCKGHLDLLDG
jgi:hypothetical protein